MEVLLVFVGLFLFVGLALAWFELGAYLHDKQIESNWYSVLFMLHFVATVAILGLLILLSAKLL
ncbi:MAG: hypothetical protein GY797_33490 [Deltaproteobacteria bacterium]|nr:hypothetical protein [Deltaproteobacteria bacterium]